MVIDTSALVAILNDEAEKAEFISSIARSPRKLMAAPTFFEALLVLEKQRGEAGVRAWKPSSLTLV